MRKDLLFLIAVFVLVAVTWNVLTPPYENLDEIEHAEVIRYIAVTGKLPVHGEAQAVGYHVRQEASQPPLYHILAAGWMRLWHLPTAPHNAEPVPAHIVICGPGDTFYNRATWTRAPISENWSGARLTVRALRFFSTLLQTATVVGVWVLAKRVYPTGSLPWLATALVAFNPQFLFVASGVNNDNAVIPLATWGLVLAYDFWDKGPTLRRAVLFGIISGLAALSKLSGMGVLGMGGLAVLIYVWQHKLPLRRLIVWWALMVLPALVLVVPWLLRNLHLYGDPTALTPMLAIVGRRTYPIAFSEITPMLLSYWGQMPCAFYPRAAYCPYYLVIAGGLAGLVTGWRYFDRRQRGAFAFCGIWFVVIVLAWLRWNSITPATGGRLLFPASSALALLLAAGWHGLARPWITRLWAALLPLWAVVMLVAGPILFFAPPAHYPNDAPIPNSLDATFDQAITLRGYDVHITQHRLACLLASTSYCRPALDVMLYWQAVQPVDANLVMALHLVSAASGSTDLRMNYHHWPARGNWPTSAWPVGTIIRDHYVLPLPPSDRLTQAWTLQVALIDPATGARLPVAIAGTPVGDVARLTTLRIPDALPVLPGWGNQATPVTFAEHVRLLDATVEVENAGWRVALFWESLIVLPDDYTVFVHAYSPTGELLATGDGPPLGGAFPTSLWLPGDLILDVHHLPLPPDSNPARVAVGLYHPISGERLPAAFNAQPLADSAVIVWEARP